MPRISVHVGKNKVSWLCERQREHLEQYVESLHSEYFDYLLQTHMAAFEQGDHKEQASMALRQLYMQVLETTIAVLCCTLQSPSGLPMWMLTYSNGDLKTAVKSLKQGERLPGALRNFEFKAYAESILSRALQPSGESWSETEITEALPLLVNSLEYLTTDFLNEDLHDEYNSIKHGHRATTGGLELRFLPEGSAEWLSLKMPYGSHFPRRFPRSGKQDLEIEYRSLGYSPQQTAQRISVAIGILNLHLALLTVEITQKFSGRSGHIPSAEVLHEAWIDQGKRGSLLSATNNLL